MPRFEVHPARRPAVVTGASSGIGEATARALAAAGHPVVLGARRLDLCTATAAALRAEGGEAEAFALDLTEAASIERFAEAAQAAFGDIEVLVSNAGEVLPTNGADTPPDAFEQQVQVNLLGAQRLVSLLAPGMLARSRGDIVFVTSDVVRAPRPRMASYVTSKWGLEGLARAMQMEMEGTGVRVSIVRPGPTVTGQGRTWDPDSVDDVMQDWARWGFMRHPGYLRAIDVARVIESVVSTPRGTHLVLVEVQPEAPVEPREEPSEVAGDKGRSGGATLTLLDGGGEGGEGPGGDGIEEADA